MKKFALLILTIFMAFGMVACMPTVIPTVNLDSTKPWTSYEKSTYSVQKKNVISGPNNTKIDGDVIANGELTFELKPTDINDTTLNRESTVKMSFSLTYNDKAVEKDRGKTDTITSEVSFIDLSLTPTKSTKTAVIAKRDGEKRTDSYSITANYTSLGEETTRNKSVFTYENKDGAKETRELRINGTDAYDNESLYFLIRAIEALKPGASGISFQLVNLFDCHQASNNFFKYSMSLTAEKDTVVKTLGSWAYDLGLESDGSFEHFKVNCIKSTLKLSSEKSGPSQELYFANDPFTVNGKSAKKVLISMVTREYDLNNISENFRTYCDLTSYTNVAP